MASIFISFIHEESSVAEALQSLIRTKLETFDVFLSSEWQIYAGEDWLHKITDELNSANVVLLLLSSMSVARPWVNFEAGGAWLSGKHVIPVCHAGMTPAALPKPYSSLQGLSIPQDAYYLVRSIHHYLYPTKIPIPPFPLDDKNEQELKKAVQEFAITIGLAPSGDEPMPKG